MHKELSRLRDLRDRGVLTDEEFERAVGTLDGGGGQLAADDRLSDESTADPSSSSPNFVGTTKSKPRWGRRMALGLAAVALVAVGSVGTVVLLDGSGEPVETQAVSDPEDAEAEEPAEEPSAEAGGEEAASEQPALAAEDEQQAVEPGAPAADPGDPASYYSLGDASPALTQDCPGLLGFCLGAPVEAVTAAFGTEEERWPNGEGGTGRRWHLDAPGTDDSGYLVADFDEVGAMSYIAVGHSVNSTSFRAATPGLAAPFGDLTVAQLIEERGTPHNVESFSGEGATFFDFSFLVGPEGTVTLSYTVELDWSDDRALAEYSGPEDIMGAMSGERLDNVSVSYQ